MFGINEEAKMITLIEESKNILPYLAKLMKQYYDNLINEGFDSESALKLTLSYQSSMTKIN
jgi:hypothetical protein